MKVRIKTFDNKALFYETKGACAFDFKASHDIVIEPGKLGVVDTGTVVEIPEGYVMLILPRSSTFKNFGLIQVNGVGVIDNDYHGDNDTSMFQYLNMSDKPVTIEKGTRIGQGMFVKILKADFELTEETMKDEDRGGFGTTGNK